MTIIVRFCVIYHEKSHFAVSLERSNVIKFIRVKILRLLGNNVPSIPRPAPAILQIRILSCGVAFKRVDK